MRRFRLRALQVTLGLMLVLFGTAKIHSGHLPSYILGKHAFYGVAGMELAFGMLLLAGKCCRIACWFVVALALGGSYLGLAWSGRSCGCFGMWLEFGPRSHLFVAGGLGILSSFALLADPARPVKVAQT